MKSKGFSRRSFLQKTAMTTGMASVAPLAVSAELSSEVKNQSNSPREVWIAGVSQMGIRTETPELMVESILEVLKEADKYKPDFVCLPELFPFEYVEQKLSLVERVEYSEKVLGQFALYSKNNNCYTVCPVYTSSGGKIYNSAVVFNRAGERIGQYNKIHETVGLIRQGVTCGALFQPAIPTEFGPIGIQICYDINWDDGWLMFKGQDVKIIFWVSAFDGGKQLNMKALQNKCIIASSTNKNTSNLIDISGETVTGTGIWDRNFYCGRVNLQKAFLPTWDNLKAFSEIREKYGRKVRITTFHEEEWTIIECISPDVFIEDIMREYDLKSHTESLREAEIVQNESRK